MGLDREVQGRGTRGLHGSMAKGTVAKRSVANARAAWVCALVALVGLAGCAPDGADPMRPDIVLIVIDTLRADHVGIYGSERPTTPHIDALAREGSHYRRAFAQSSWTLPSMTSLLTGLLPHKHRVGRDPEDHKRFGRLAPEIPTLAERLADVGYARGAIMNNTFLAPEFGLARGFDDYDYRGATKWKVRSAEDTVDAALAWTADQDRPYFLVVHFMEPHLFYDPPEDVRGVFTGDGPAPVDVPFGTNRAIARIAAGELAFDAVARDYIEKLYDEEILYVDRAIGRLARGLRDRARWDRTVVVVTADHGEEFFDHGGFEHGHTLYGELVRIPLIVRGPGLARGEVAGVVQHVDVARGILELAGASVDGLAEGIDPFALLREGLDPGDRPSLSENVLYGPPRAAWTDGRQRLQMRLDRKTGEVWTLTRDGLEDARLERPALREASRRLAHELGRVRGGLEAWTPSDGPRLANDEILTQLKALGYVESVEDPGSAESP